MENIVIFTACTDNYLNRAISLYNSLNKHNKNIHFHITLININKDNYFENNKNDLLTINYDNVNYKDEALRVYASCLRAKIFPTLIKQYDYVFWMDADTIIRKNLYNMFKILLKNDITLYKNEKIRKDTIDRIGLYKTGIIGVKRNKKIIHFTELWRDMIFKKDINELKWFEDQKSISYLLKTLELKIYNLPINFIDWNFNNDSHIWVGKGERKNKTIYLNEEAIYK